MTEPFWRAKAMRDFTRKEWESLCDGCGKCCLIKLECADSGHIEFTDVACRLLDGDTAQCKNYACRTDHVPDCIRITPDNIASLIFMPASCAYRIIHEGGELPDWHPLVSGDPETVHLAGQSVRFRTCCETQVAEESLPDHIVTWPQRR